MKQGLSNLLISSGQQPAKTVREREIKHYRMMPVNQLKQLCFYRLWRTINFTLL
jgi:hypothetical protein